MELPELFDILKDETRPFEDRLRACLASLREALRAERGCLMITRSGRELMMHDGDDTLNLNFPFSRNVVGEAMIGATGLVCFQKDTSSDGGPESSMAMHGVRAALCAPILGPEEEDFGVIYFDTKLGGALFNKEQLERTQTLAREIGALLA